jgi:hypothetical protein
MSEMDVNWHKKHSILIYLCIIFIFLVIVKIYLSYRFPTPFVFGDEYLYAQYTKEILQNPISVFSPEKYQIFPPGYPIILIPSFLLYPSVSAVYRAILAINILLSTSLLFITFFILKSYINKQDAFLGSILITLLPFLTINNYIIFSENLYIPALVLACLLLIISIEKKNSVLHFLTGFVFGFLPIIRAFGILALLSFYLIIIYLLFNNKDRYQDFLKERFFLIITPVATFCSYIFIKNLFFSNLYGYNSAAYSNVLIWMTRDFPSFFVFLKSLAAEFDYLIITTYIGFFLLAAFLALSWKKIDIRLKSLLLFTFFYSCFSIILTILHMLTKLQTPNTPVFSEYLIFGRYLDPVVPLIFILGLIYLCRYLPEQIKTVNPTNNVQTTFSSRVLSTPKELILLFIGVSVFFIFTYPIELKYKVVNVSAIYYLGYLTQYSQYFFYAVPIILFILFSLLFRYPRHLIVILILFSIIITVPTFNWIEKTSNNTNLLNVYEKISRDSEGRHDNIIYLDYETFKNPYTTDVCMIKFWGLADTFYYTNKVSDLKIQPDYIISKRILPFKVISIDSNSIIIYKPVISTGNFPNQNIEPKIQNISDNTWVMDNISIAVWNPSQHPLSYNFKIKVISYYTNRTLYVSMNDARIYRTTITSKTVKEITIPVNLTGGFSYIRLSSPNPCIKPSDVSLSTDKRCLSFKIINFTLNSQ